MSKQNVIGKIVAKTLGDPKKLLGLPADVKDLWLGVIAGIATGVGHQEDTRNGNVYTFIRGNFRAISEETGESYDSGKLFMPTGINELIASHFEGENPPSSVSFAFRVGVFRSTNAAGYSWKAEPLTEPTSKSPMDLLVDSLGEKVRVPALAAPKVESKDEKKAK